MEDDLALTVTGYRQPVCVLGLEGDGVWFQGILYALQERIRREGLAQPYAVKLQAHSPGGGNRPRQADTVPPGTQERGGMGLEGASMKT